jgi:thiol-disulfide isomerase/thioredoxin
MIKKSLLLLCCLIFSISAEDFIENQHYHKMRHIAPQDTTEIHYFFSFYCPSCARMAEKIDQYLQEQNHCLVSRHPLVNSEAGILLLRAYDILLDKEQGYNYKKILYNFSPQQKITEKELITAFNKAGHPHFARWWQEESGNTPFEQKIKAQLKTDGALVKEYRLTAIPTVVVVGPKGAYYLQPIKPVTIDNFTACLDSIVKMQNSR